MSSDDAVLPEASTVLPLRDGDSGLEVLMVRRPERGSFAGAWVFPGGKREDEDAADGGDDEAIARRVGVRETQEEVGLAMHADALVPVSVWTPPQHIPKRIRTWFFLGAAGDEDIVLQEGEIAAAEWVSPRAMLDRHAAGEVTLFPPTFVTLAWIDGASSVRECLARFSGAPVADQRSHVTAYRDGLLFSWGADDGTAGVPASERHRLDTSELPWTYTRGSAER